VTVCPATVIVALRADPVLAATVTVAVPAPVDGFVLVTLIQLDDSVTDHEQPLAVDTLKLSVPPAAAIVAAVGDTV
jgi:hypothetical protein